MMNSFHVPFPPKELNPNKILHWAQKYKHQQAHKKAVATACIFEKLPKYEGRVDVCITFHPPDNRRRDKDNMISAFKWAQDTIADRIGVDDADWRVTYELGCVSDIGGHVWVDIREGGTSDVPFRGTIGGGDT